ncbi:MAG: NERD domain-containing protein [Eubacterium sp.]|nr:NERD domain-containing protein [Eubacterium sp.]
MTQLIKMLFILFSIPILEILLNNIFKSPQIKGKAFERGISKELEKLNKQGIYGKVLRNIYLPKNIYETSEIDVLFITTAGIFVVECKNYSGWIFGTEYDFKWTQSLPRGKRKSKKIRFYNPMKQNSSHINPLRNYLVTLFPTKTINIYPIVVFSSSSTLKDVPSNMSHPVVYSHGMKDHIMNIYKQNNPCLTQVQVDDIYEKMKSFTKVSKEIKKQHIENIRVKYNDAKSLSGSDGKISSIDGKTNFVANILSICIAIIGIGAVLVLYFYPKYFKKVNNVVDERTGKAFSVIEDKVQVYLPVEISCDSSDVNDSYVIQAKYDNKAKLIEKNIQYKVKSDLYKSKSEFYSYDVNGNLSQLKEDYVDGDSYMWDVGYLFSNNMSFSHKEINESESVDGTFKPYYYLEYNPNGLFEKDYISSSSEFVFAENMHDVGYLSDMSGLINWYKSETKEDSLIEKFTYNDKVLLESTVEYTKGDISWSENNTYSYENNHLSSIYTFYNNASEGITEEDENKYIYINDKLTDITYSDDISAINEPDIDSINASVIIDYSEDNIKHVSCNFESGDSISYDFGYDDNEFTSLVRSWSGSDNRKENIQIKYQLFEVDIDVWNEYRDNYYIYRYELMNDCLNYGIPNECFGVLQTEDGYYENYIKYYIYDNGNAFGKKGFGWAAIPSILDGDFNKQN